MIPSIGLGQLIRDTNARKPIMHLSGYKIDPDDFKDWPLDAEGNPIRRRTLEPKPLPPDEELNDLQRLVKRAIETGNPVDYPVPNGRSMKLVQYDVHRFAYKFGRKVKCKRGSDWRVMVISRKG